MEDISVYNEVISTKDTEKIRKMMLHDFPFFYGECDNHDTPPTGLVCYFERIQIGPFFKEFLDNLLNKIYEKNENIKNMKLQRIYLNYFSPTDNPYFHIDGHNVMTCLYYLNPELNDDEGGETQFLINDEIRGVRSKPGRLVIFDGSLKHRATSFRSHPRLTLAIKFYK